MTPRQIFTNACIVSTLGVFFLNLSNGFFPALGGALLYLGGCLAAGGAVRWLIEKRVG
jgi:hypothetical protein